MPQGSREEEGASLDPHPPVEEEVGAAVLSSAAGGAEGEGRLMTGAEGSEVCSVVEGVASEEGVGSEADSTRAGAVVGAAAAGAGTGGGRTGLGGSAGL